MRNVFGRVSIQVAHRMSAALALSMLLGLATVFSAAQAAAQTENTALNKGLAKFDLAIMGVGQFTNTTNGTNKEGFALNSKPSTDFNVMGQIRFTQSKWVGLELNYVHGRYAYDFNTTVQNPGATIVATPLLDIVQTNADEYSLGYVVHPHPTRLLKPFAGAGAGTIDFAPTAGGGEGFKSQARIVYFYEVGADAPITSNFGVRAQVRQAFYLHPDYETNYFTDLKRNITSEPVIGFYLRF